MRMSFPGVESSGVSPSERPVVVQPLTASKRMTSNGAFSVMSRRHGDDGDECCSVNAMAAAFLTSMSGMLLPPLMSVPRLPFRPPISVSSRPQVLR